MGYSQDLEIIAEQEKTLIFEHFDADVAWSLGTLLRDHVRSLNAPAAVDVRRFGQVLFSCALPGATPDNAEWIRRKSNVVQRFLRSSYAIGLSLKASDQTLATKYVLTETDYAVHGGSFPITVAHAGVVGSVTVSGLPQREDHNAVVSGLCKLLGKDYGKLSLPSS